ncbi:MAG TPA: DUF1223 domain-containing protein [Beijerinckiaceae bacterium]|nr:DUF1223 domain-containing protein [Beijerinckiaceae bacterium]
MSCLHSCRNGLRALLFLAASSLIATGAAAKQNVPYVVELFTSQGCSSCPPADQLLTKISREPQVVALSLPVDYWDYMGWKDTLASPEFTARQKNYAAARGDGHVYTPQAVIDGLVHVVGSNKNSLKTAAKAAYGASGAMSVSLALKQVNGKLVADVGGANAAAKSGLLWLVRVAKKRTVVVRAGENAGRTLTYTNVVRSLRSFGRWNGTPAQFEVPSLDLGADADGYVVLLQAGSSMRPGAILAFAKGDGM